jgi:hypothetical protein
VRIVRYLALAVRLTDEVGPRGSIIAFNAFEVGNCIVSEPLLTSDFVSDGSFRQLRGLFEKLVDWRRCAAVMQNEAVTVMPSCSGGGNIVVA